MMYAYEFLARDRAGLVLVGRDGEWELEWMGTEREFRKVDRLESEMTCL